MTQTDPQSVTLPTDIIERVERRLPYTEFASTSEYIAYVTEEVLHHVEADSNEETFESADEREVKDRLESLGYLKE